MMERAKRGRLNRDRPPAAADATLIKRLEAAGAGAQLGEYAYDFTGENVHYDPSRNPHDVAHMTGGSSGGLVPRLFFRRGLVTCGDGDFRAERP